MKKLSVVLALMLILGAAVVSAQPVEGKKFELGTSVDYYSFGSSGSTWASYLSVPVRFGWYIWKGLEIEPQVTVSIPLKNAGYFKAAYIGSLNVFYNYKIGKKFIPFAGGGFGLGNGLPYPMYTNGSILAYSGWKTWAWDLAGGVKYLLSDSVVLRVEYRYSRYHLGGDAETGFYNIGQGFVGFSYLF